MKHLEECQAEQVSKKRETGAEQSPNLWDIKKHNRGKTDAQRKQKLRTFFLLEMHHSGQGLWKREQGWREREVDVVKFEVLDSIIFYA